MLAEIEITRNEKIKAEMIDDIWRKYDVDGNGTLDVEEARCFIREVLDQNITDEAFDEVFKELDIDGSGTINRDEIAIFINKLAKNDEPSPLLIGADGSPRQL